MAIGKTASASFGEPFSPIYGVGGVLITLALHRFENASPLVIYAVSAAFGAAFEIFRRVVWKALFRHCGLELYRPTLQYRRKRHAWESRSYGDLRALAWVKLAAPC